LIEACLKRLVVKWRSQTLFGQGGRVITRSLGH
jgi:hypothetical protein